MRGYYITSGVIGVIGAATGAALAYFNSGALAVGATFGALAGIIFSIMFVMPAGSSVSSIPPDMHE